MSKNNSEIRIDNKKIAMTSKPHIIKKGCVTFSITTLCTETTKNMLVENKKVSAGQWFSYEEVKKHLRNRDNLKKYVADGAKCVQIQVLTPQGWRSGKEAFKVGEAPKFYDPRNHYDDEYDVENILMFQVVSLI